MLFYPTLNMIEVSREALRRADASRAPLSNLGPAPDRHCSRTTSRKTYCSRMEGFLVMNPS